MNFQPILSDDLIILRPLRENDFDALLKVAKDPLIWGQHPNWDRYKNEAYSEYFKDSINSKGALIIIDKETNEIIGSSRFKLLENAENAVEIGWSFLSRDYWGGKYNYSMKKLMIDHAFEFVDDIIFYIGKDNIRSQKAVIKIGGKRITETHLQHLMTESNKDWTYRINKKDWK